MSYIWEKNFWNSQNRISALNTRNISKKDLEKIVEVEQDMWAREEWLWEYVRCECCATIFSKEDIFWHLERKLKIKTVWEIERVLWVLRPICLNCWEETTPIFDRNKYIEQVRERYSNTIQSFLSVYRDETWEIRWFFDWYVDNFDSIYWKEFEHYYANFWIEWIKRLIKERFWVDTNWDILVSSALWFEESYWTFFNLYNLMRFFYSGVYERCWNINWVYESKIWTNTHAIYEITWARRLWITQDERLIPLLKNNNPKFISDIFVHQEVWRTSVESMMIWPKDFIRKHWSFIKQITTHR